MPGGSPELSRALPPVINWMKKILSGLDRSSEKSFRNGVLLESEQQAIAASLAGISGGFFIEINIIAKRVAFLY
jgi:hypothetical protein